MISPTRFWRRHFTGLLGLACALAVPGAHAAESPVAAPRVREPAVAGLFYPRDPAELSRMIDALLAAAHPEAPPGELKALICPHAGYPYSGPVAASAYRLLVGRAYDTVVVMGPAHYAYLLAAAVTDAAIYRTSLGDVPVSAQAARLAGFAPFALDPSCRVVRPGWFAQSSRAAPDRDTADTWEHSVEVQVPFLQKTLAGFQLVPVVFGDVDPGRAAQALLRILDDRTLIIASSDLSHYDTYAHAQVRDRKVIEAICRLDPDAVGDDDACGHLPIRTLLYVARQRGWQARLLDYRNSGDTTGDKSKGVVGYAAIVFFAPAAAASVALPARAAPAARYSAADRRWLLGIARQTVREVAMTGRLPAAPSGDLAPELTAARGCFVTLTEHGQLRGCIGNLQAQGPLVRSVIENARNAAVRDPRFGPVTASEVDRLEIEISVLTEPKPLLYSTPEDLLRRLRPGVDGVVLQMGSRGATYLPQVWEQIPDPQEFLNQLAEKAGCAPDAWREPDTTVFIYQVESFKESERGTAN